MPVSTSRQASALARLAELSLPGQVHVGTAPEPVRRLPSGLAAIDALLEGGVPRGRISEFLGPHSSGKTSLLLSLLAATTRRGEVAAWVDLADAVHPESLLAAGADLHRLLWVRPAAVIDGLRCTELLLQAGGFAFVVLDLGAVRLRPLRSHVWPRLRHAAEQSHTALVVLAPHRVAGSFAVLNLSFQLRLPLWRRRLWPLFEGFEAVVVMVRNKLGAPGRQIVIRVRESGSSPEPAFTLTRTMHAHDSR